MRREAVCKFAVWMPLLLATAQAAEPITQTTMLAHSCFSCHGIDGIGSLKIPKLKGVEFKDLKATLTGFKLGTEKSTIMGRHAEAYTDEEIALVSKYFAELK